MNLQVTEHGTFRYQVRSESRDHQYIVDLTERVRNGMAHGRCDCTYFDTTCNPNLRKTGIRKPYALTRAGQVMPGVTECKHIAAAREHVMEHVILPMLATAKHGLTE